MQYYENPETGIIASTTGEIKGWIKSTQQKYEEQQFLLNKQLITNELQSKINSHPIIAINEQHKIIIESILDLAKAQNLQSDSLIKLNELLISYENHIQDLNKFFNDINNASNQEELTKINQNIKNIINKYE